jgi:hypothetical protein
MAKKTPEERIAELDAKRAKADKKHKAEVEAIVTAKRREQAHVLNKRRQDDTRRKILVGAMYLDCFKDDEEKMNRLKQRLDSYLTKDHDRALFDLPPLPPKTE